MHGWQSLRKGVSAGCRGPEKGTYDITHGCQQAVHVGEPNRASVSASSDSNFQQLCEERRVLVC